MYCKLHTEKNGSQGLGREVRSPLPVLVLTSTSSICNVKTPGEPGYDLSPCLYSMFYKHKPKMTISHLKWIYVIRNYLVVGAGKTVRLEPLLQMLEVFQPGSLSCAVRLTWLVGVGACKQHPFIVPRKK